MKKIVVIADDLTGAAEVAGAAFRYGLSAEVQIGQLYPSNADVIVVDADSRSQPADVAFARVFALTQQIGEADVGLIFKKVDSILRGPVLTELTAMRLAAGLQQCLLVCANPRKHRTVSAGRIYVDSVPLHKTQFALDPEHPRHSDCAVELLLSGRGASGQSFDIPDDGAIGIVKPGDACDATIAIGDVSSTADLDDHVHQWQQRRETTLLAGSAEFFEALLRGVVHCDEQATWDIAKTHQRLQALDGKTLLVSGTRLSRCEGWTSVDLQPAKPRATCIAETLQVLTALGRVAICAADMVDGSQSERVQLVTDIAAALLATSALDQVWIEGGRTASNLIRELSIQRLQTLAEVGDGIVVLAEPGRESPQFIVKPGSYPWPRTLLVNSSSMVENHMREVV